MPYGSVYEIEWIMLDDIEDYLKVPKWTERSGHMREDVGEDVSAHMGQEASDIEVGFVPELGYHGSWRMSTHFSGPIICWKDMLSVGNAVLYTQ